MLRQKNARKKSVIQFHVLNVCHVKQTGLTVFERCQNGNKQKMFPSDASWLSFYNQHEKNCLTCCRLVYMYF